MNKQKKVEYVVTGGAGFIGSHLVDALLTQGCDVSVIDDFSLGSETNLLQHKKNPRLTIYQKSVCANLSTLLNGKTIAAFFHLAALPNVQLSLTHPAKTHRVNVGGMLNALETCRRLGIKRFIFISSASLYGDSQARQFHETTPPSPLSPYALHKLIGEYYCNLYKRTYGLETMSLRYFNVFGPRQSAKSDYGFLISKFISMVKENTPPTIHGDGNQTRDFIYISDVVNATLMAARTQNAECFGQAFNIASGKATSVNEITEHILALGKSNLVPLHGPAVIEQRHSLANISKAKYFLKWQPEVSLTQGLKKTYHSLA